MTLITAMFLCVLAHSVFAVPRELSGAISSSISAPSPDCHIEEFPKEGSKCSAAESGQTRPYPVSCTRFLECKSNSTWTQEKCPRGTFYTKVLQACVPPEEADCAAVLFGREAKVFIEGSSTPLKENFGRPLNKSAGKPFVVTACQGCFNKTSCPPNNPAVGSTLEPRNIWTQILVAARRANSDFYSFAFNRIKGEEFNVLTEIVTDGMMHVWSKLFKRNPSPESNTWRVVPITSQSVQPGLYRIASTRSQRALTLADRVIGDAQGRLHHALELIEVDEFDSGQLWKFPRVRGN